MFVQLPLSSRQVSPPFATGTQNLGKLSTAELKALIHALNASGAKIPSGLDREGMIAALQKIIDDYEPENVRLHHRPYSSVIQSCDVLNCMQNDDKPARAVHPYNLFMEEQLPKFRAEHPGLNEKESFDAVVAIWKTHPSNPSAASS